MAFVAVVGCAVRRVSAPGIALANAQMGQLVAVFVPPGAGLGNAQMDQLVAGTAAAGGGRSQMADGEGREGRWWPVGGLARTKPAALRATRLLPCVVTLGLASNTPRRRPLNICLSAMSAATHGLINQSQSRCERCKVRMV